MTIENENQPELVPFREASKTVKPKKVARIRAKCSGCDGPLEPERARVDIEFCKTCAPGWPTDNEEVV